MAFSRWRNALIALCAPVTLTAQAVQLDSACFRPLAAAVDSLGKLHLPSTTTTLYQRRAITTLTSAHALACTRVVAPPPDTTTLPDTTPATGRRLTMSVTPDTLVPGGRVFVYGKVDSAGVVLLDSIAAPTLSDPAAVSLRWGREGRRWVLADPVTAGPLELTMSHAGQVLRDTVLVTLSAPAPPVGPPAPPPPPSADSALRRIAPFDPPGTTPPFIVYDQLWRQWEPTRWAQDGALWSGANYYDRALTYYAQWIRLRDTTYRRRADQLAVNYRDGYLVPNNGQASPHWSQLDGVAMHYWITGDPASLAALRLAAYNVGASGTWPRTGPYTDARQQARALVALLLAWQTNAPAPPNGKTWAQMLDESLDAILPQQSADGAWRYPANTCDKSLNYMGAMLAHALARVHDQYRADARIPGAVQRTVDFLWTQWRGTDAVPSFAYYEAPGCSNQHGVGGTNGTPDLTGLFGPAFGWVARRDPAYIARATAVFDAANRGLYPQGSKQFNQWAWGWVTAGYIP